MCGWWAFLGTDEDLGIIPYNVYIRYGSYNFSDPGYENGKHRKANAYSSILFQLRLRRKQQYKI